MSGESDHSDFDLHFADRPHDGFFRAFFSDPAHAASFLKNSRLPEGIAANTDWTTLAGLDPSFISPELRQSQADLLFTARHRGRDAYFYLIFEHQSTVDESMRLRLLGYQYEIYRRHYRLYGPPLAPAIGFVFNQGPEGWHLSTAFEDLFELDEKAASDWGPFIPKFQHLLFDLTTVDPDQGGDELTVQTALQLMKLARERKHREFLQWLRQTCVEYAFSLPDGDLKTMLLYLFVTDSDLDAAEIVGTLSLSSNQEKIAMSAAEKLRAEGEARGEARGKAVGERIGQIKLLENLLGLEPGDIGPLSIMQLDARLAQLQSLFDSRFPRL